MPNQKQSEPIPAARAAEPRAQPQPPDPAAAFVGERLRALRVAQGLSVRTLAARTEFSPSFISQVENGLASPSIASLGRIAQELRTNLGEFFGAPDAEAARPASGVRVVRATARRSLVSSWSRARVEALGRPGAGESLEPVLITFEPGGRSGGSPHESPTDVFALVYDGQLVLELGDKSHTLARGDAVSLSAGTPHRWENASAGTASVLVVGLLSAPRTARAARRFPADPPSHHHVARKRKQRDSAR